jgi:CMP-N-acetylneuraminic acid synthetase
MKRLCTICARGGSKGVPDKNLRPLLGRPLVAHTVEQALTSGLFDVIAVSSDSPDIIQAATAAGAHEAVQRPADLASDTAGKLPAIHHALHTVEERLAVDFDQVIDLDATAPLRTVGDITGAICLLEDTGAVNVLSGSVAHKSPYFNLVEERDDGTVGLSKPTDPPILRRQAAPACFDLNGSVYVWQRAAFHAAPRLFYDSTRLYEMPPERSFDIDREIDFDIVAFLMNRGPLS